MPQDDLQGPIACQACQNDPLFRDPRPSPPPLPSRKAILRKLLLVHAPDTDYFRAAIDALTPHEEHSDEPCFPQFMRLPLEIREMIWLMAVPPRTFDLRRSPQPCDAGACNAWTACCSARVSMPRIAWVCHEARSIMLRHATKVFLPSCGRTASFLMPRDRLLYDFARVRLGRPDTIKEVAAKTGTGRITLTRYRELPPVLGSSTIIVPSEATGGMRLLDTRLRERKRKRWKFLRNLKSLDSILWTVPGGFKTVEFDVDMEDRPAVLKAFTPIHPPQLFAEHGLVRVIVDLNDDQALAEIAALHDKTAWSGPLSVTSCLNCLRKTWICSQSLYAKCFWLILHSDELSEAEKVLVLNTDKPEIAPYKHDHPWVNKKLSQAPRIRPAVTFTLQPMDYIEPDRVESIHRFQRLRSGIPL